MQERTLRGYNRVTTTVDEGPFTPTQPVIAPEPDLILPWQDLDRVYTTCAEMLVRATVALGTFRAAPVADITDGPQVKGEIIQQFTSDIATMNARLSAIRAQHTPEAIAALPADNQTLHGFHLTNEYANWSDSFEVITEAAVSDIQAVCEGRAVPNGRGRGVEQIRRAMHRSAAAKTSQQTKRSK